MEDTSIDDSDEWDWEDKRITDNGLRITGLTEERGENDWTRTEPGVGDQTRLSGGESFCLCVCLGGTSRRELVIK